MVSGGYRASSEVISKARKIREEFPSAAKSMRASGIPKDNISNSGSLTQGVLTPEIPGHSASQMLPGTSRHDY